MSFDYLFFIQSQILKKNLVCFNLKINDKKDAKMVENTKFSTNNTAQKIHRLIADDKY